MLFFSAVIIYYTIFAAFGKSHLRRLILEVFLYLIPQFQQHTVYLRTYCLQSLKSLSGAVLQTLLLIVVLLEYIKMSADHAYRRVKYRPSAFLYPGFLAFNNLRAPLYQT